METKTCSKCKCSLPITEFNWRKKDEGILAWQCKDCQRATQRAYYANTPEYRIKVKADSKRRRLETKRKYLAHLKQQKCMDCGIQDHVVLTHDHRQPELKKDCVSRMIYYAYWKRVKEEIDKCDVVCFNCHAHRTAKTQRWYEKW
jgi:hypothetical protein